MPSSRSQERIRYRYGICLNDKCEKCKSKEVLEIPARKEFVCPECGKSLRECPPPKRGGNKWLYAAVGIIALIAICGGVWWFMSSGDESKPKELPKAAQVVDSLIKDSLQKAEKALKDSLQNAEEAINDSHRNDSLKSNAEKAQQERDSLQAVADSLQRVANQRQQTTPPPVRTTPSAPSPTPSPKASTAPASASGSKNLGYAVFKGTLRNGQPDDVNGRLVFKTSHVIDSRDPKGRIAESGDYVIGEFSEGHLVQGIWYGSDNQVKGSIIIGK